MTRHSDFLNRLQERFDFLSERIGDDHELAAQRDVVRDRLQAARREGPTISEESLRNTRLAVERLAGKIAA